MMKPVKTITIDEIRKLLKKTLGVEVTRAPIYQWMKTKKFPKQIGIGRPARWRANQVNTWIANQLKKTAKQ